MSTLYGVTVVTLSTALSMRARYRIRPIMSNLPYLVRVTVPRALRRWHSAPLVGVTGYYAQPGTWWYIVLGGVKNPKEPLFEVKKGIFF